MASTREFDLEDEEQLCLLGAALNSPVRIQILKLLYFKSYSVGEIAKELSIPTSSAALYVRSLEKAGLINTVVQQGSRGSMKICSRKNDLITIRMTVNDPAVVQTDTVSMPVGCFTSCQIGAGCGLASETGRIAPDDQPWAMYLPERVKAQLLWSTSGYVEYSYPYQLPPGARVQRMNLSFEACSETFNYNDHWPSDVTLWINGRECGTWRCPGDFGSRRGTLNPSWWPSGSTQYGKLVTLEVTREGSFLNYSPSSPVTLNDLALDPSRPIAVRIGNKPDAEHVGGFNIFGRKFGDFAQDILLTFYYQTA